MHSKKSRFCPSHSALNSFPMRVWKQTKALMPINRVTVECLIRAYLQGKGYSHSLQRQKKVLFATFNVSVVFEYVYNSVM